MNKPNAYTQQTGHHANLKLLIWLRAVAIAGQFTAVVIAKYYLGITLQTGVLYTWIGIYAFINLLTISRFYTKIEIHKWEFFTHLIVDIIILTILLKYSEGGANPFVSLYLIPLTISAITLPAIFTWTLAVITICCYSLLVWVFSPMTGHSFHANHFDVHVIGMWLGFVISAVLVAFFVVRMGRIIQQQQKKLAEQKSQQLQNEQFVKLGTLAASTAHELGTPLGTMQLAVEELQNNPKDSTQQLHVINDQIKRCKEALSVLSASVGAPPLESGQPMKVRNFIDDVFKDWQQSRPAINIETNWISDTSGPEIIAERSLKQAIKNILDNAADVSPEYVLCEASLNQDELILKVSDHGPGITIEKNEKIGQQPVSSKAKGMGLGLFLSHGIIKRFGGNVSLKNIREGGLQTTISLPIHTLAIS